MDLSLQSIKTNSWITVKKKHVCTPVSCKHCEYPIWQLSIDYYMDIQKDGSLSIRRFSVKA